MPLATFIQGYRFEAGTFYVASILASFVLFAAIRVAAKSLAK